MIFCFWCVLWVFCDEKLPENMLFGREKVLVDSV